MNVPDLDPVNLTHAEPGKVAPPVPPVPDTPPIGPDGAVEWPHDPPTGPEYGGADPLVLTYGMPLNLGPQPVSGNVLDDRPHFLLNLPDGTEVCGQDGEPWECDGYRKIREDQAELAGIPKSSSATVQATIPLDAVADMLGVSPGELAERMAEHHATTQE